MLNLAVKAERLRAAQAALVIVGKLQAAQPVKGEEPAKDPAQK